MSNPYQPPQMPQAAQYDPLRFPAICLVVIAVLMSCVAVCFLAVAATYSWYYILLGRPEIEAKAWRMAYAGLRPFITGIVCVFTAWSMANRRNRWLVIGVAVAGVITVVFSPVSFLIFWRLRQRDVWQRFRQSDSTAAPASV